MAKRARAKHSSKPKRKPRAKRSRTPKELLARGWDALAMGELDDAAELFRSALKGDATLADAHNGLGSIELAYGEIAKAEAAFAEALRLAPAPPADSDGDGWRDPSARPHLRAREGLARVMWRRHDYEEAAREYRGLLNLNPEDAQANRWVIGPLLQLAGRDAEAREYYPWYAQTYPKDPPEPHMTLCWGLALCEGGDAAGALARWWAASFFNPYIVPTLLGYEVKPLSIEGEMALSEPEYAEAYASEYSELWARAPRSWLLLGRFWEDADTRRCMDQWVDLGRRLATTSDPKARAELHARRTQAAAGPPEPVSRRVLEGWGRGPLIDTLLDKILSLRLRILAMNRRMDRDNIDPSETPRPVLEGQAHADTILQSLFHGLLSTRPNAQDLDETAYVIDMLDPMIRHFQQVLHKNLPGAKESPSI